MPYRLGIIGYGDMASGSCHSVNPREAGIIPSAVFDIRPEARAAAVRDGLRAYDDLNDFFAEKPDLVLVATSNNHHMRYACLAMEAGCNVICEKPAALNAAEVERMIDVSRRTGRFFTVHQNRRWDNDFRLMMKAVEAGKIGRLFALESHLHLTDGSGSMYNWRGMKDHGGGMLLDWGVHMIDQILTFITEPVMTVSASVRSIRSPEVDDYAKVILTFESGLIALAEVSDFAPIAMPRWMVYGERGAVTVPDFVKAQQHALIRRIKTENMTVYDPPAYPTVPGNTVTIRHQELARVSEFEEIEVESDGMLDEYGVWYDWRRIYRNIAAVLDGREELYVKPEQILRVMRVIDAAFRSSDAGETIHLH